MPLIPYADEADTDPRIEELFERARNRFGMVFNNNRLFAQSPPVLDGFLSFYESIADLDLEPDLVQLVSIMTSEINECEY